MDEDGETPADILGQGPWENIESKEKMLLLLARAPFDRAWCRRGWLVVLRADMATPELGAWPHQQARLADFISSELEEEGVFRQVVAFL